MACIRQGNNITRFKGAIVAESRGILGIQTPVVLFTRAVKASTGDVAEVV